MLLKTNCLILRPFQKSDLAPFVAYRSDPLVAAYQSWDAPYDAQEAAVLIASMSQNPKGIPDEWYSFAIAAKGKELIIGDCAFHMAGDGRQAEIGFTLARAFQGKGYATEAVNRLLDYLFVDHHLHRVRAITDVRNTPSVQLLERIGMRREGHLVENIWFKGIWGSEYLYAMLAHEWKAMRAADPRY